MKRTSHSQFFIVCAMLLVVGLSCSTPLRWMDGQPATELPATLLPENPPLVITATLEQPTPTVDTVPTDASQPPTLAPTQASSAPQPFEVERMVVKEERQDTPTPYILEMQYPRFSGSSAVAADLNQRVEQVVANQRVELDEMVKTPTPSEYSSGPHSLYMDYEVRYNDGRYVSIYFELSQYASGAAHPLPYSYTLTYDVAHQRRLQLADLFKPGVDYLSLLSEKSLASLSGRAFVDFETGAAPTEQNYQNWNLTPTALVITFDPYQVAAYAAGYVPVEIPWADFGDTLALPLP